MIVLLLNVTESQFSNVITLRLGTDISVWMSRTVLFPGGLALNSMPALQNKSAPNSTLPIRIRF